MEGGRGRRGGELDLRFQTESRGLGLFERGVTRERFNKEGAFRETLEFSSDVTLNLLA